MIPLTRMTPFPDPVIQKEKGILGFSIVKTDYLNELKSSVLEFEKEMNSILAAPPLKRYRPFYWHVFFMNAALIFLCLFVAVWIFKTLKSQY